MKKHVLLIAILVAALTDSYAQVELNLALNSRPEPYLADWVHPINGQMIITVIKATPAIDAVKLKTMLLDQNGQIIATSNLAASPVLSVADGVNVFSIADGLQLQYLQFIGSAQDLIKRTGRLAGGRYQLTVEVYDRTGNVMYAHQTRPFTITSYQLPLLMLPANNAVLDAHVASAVIIFRWTSLVGYGQEPPVYRVQVFEILPGQFPMQAFRGNQPLLDEEVRGGTTQYIWKPQLPMLDSTANQQFIWTVQTLDATGRPVPTNDPNIQGRSEPAVFRIKHKTMSSPQDTTAPVINPD